MDMPAVRHRASVPTLGSWGQRTADLTAVQASAEDQRRTGFYLGVRFKFVLACGIAVLWTALSVWLSQSWLRDLGGATTCPGS